MSKLKENIILALIMAVVLNISTASLIYRFKHPHKTETEVFLATHKWFLWSFEE